MKEFFKYVAATVVGIIIFLIVAGIFGMMSIVGMIASGQATQTVEDGSVLVLNLSGSISEQGGRYLWQAYRQLHPYCWHERHHCLYQEG